MNELQSIRGFEVLPLGAVSLKMREYNQPLSCGEDFQAFARFLGVDAVLVGSITDYQPYYPPRVTLKVSWYAANPGFHPVKPGYGLPWGTKEEKQIPRWVHQEAQRALAAEQLKTQTPDLASPPPQTRVPLEAIDATAASTNEQAIQSTQSTQLPSAEQPVDDAFAQTLPDDWPDPRGFIPDSPSIQRPPLIVQHEPIISHMTTFNGHDEDFTERLADYFYFRDDARFGGWQAYLQRSEDFIRFCCHLHLSETLVARRPGQKPLDLALAHRPIYAVGNSGGTLQSPRASAGGFTVNLRHQATAAPT